MFELHTSRGFLPSDVSEGQPRYSLRHEKAADNNRSYADNPRAKFELLQVKKLYHDNRYVYVHLNDWAMALLRFVILGWADKVDSWFSFKRSDAKIYN